MRLVRAGMTCALAVGATLSLLLPGSPASSAPNVDPGFVYVMTNLPGGNSITVFRRAADGTLTQGSTFATGGLGNGTAPDALRSQGGLVRGGQYLFAVNAGSDEISALQIQRGSLVLTSKVPSGGLRPTSLAVSGALLYVVNAGSGTIVGFRVLPGGVLQQLPHSTKPLSGGPGADPSQIGFARGRLLLVTEKQPSRISSYIVNSNGLAEGPFPNASSGQTPFGFDLGGTGHVIVSEAFGGAPGAGALSSYAVVEHGGLSVVSGSVPNGQTASCWLVTTNDGALAYTSNSGSGTISSYSVLPGGNLAPLEAVAGTTTPGGAPVDMALDSSGTYLYTLVNTTGTISGFQVGADGTLAPVSETTGLPPFAQGIVAQ